MLIPLSEDKIFDTIRSANSNAASGLDGFSIPFFKHFWPQLRGLVQAIIQCFGLGTVDISRLNYVVLTLIPKVKGEDLIIQFRSIALINNFANLPAKGFATRLSPIAHRTLSPFQSAFVEGRFILDGILCLHEIVQDLRVWGSKGVILKLDFEKAFDTMEHEFILKMLKCKGFDDRWCMWIKMLLDSRSSSILLNGIPGKEFKCKRGVRQGDPISPYYSCWQRICYNL